MATQIEEQQTTIAPRHFDADERRWRDCIAASTQRARDFYGPELATVIDKAQSIALEGGVWPDPSGVGGKVRSQTDPQRVYSITTFCACEAATFAADQPIACKHAMALLIHKKAEQLQRELSEARRLPEAPVSVNTQVTIAGQQAQLTVRGFAAASVLADFAMLIRQLEDATPVSTADAEGAPPVAVPPQPPPVMPTPPPVSSVTEAITPPLCPRHQRPMKPSKFGGFYCTVKEADGSYCKAKT